MRLLWFLLPLAAPHAHHHRHLQDSPFADNEELFHEDDSDDCGSRPATTEELGQLVQAIQNFTLTSARNSFSATVPVRFHILKDIASRNDITDSMLDDYIDVWNAEIPGFSFVQVEKTVTVNKKWFEKCSRDWDSYEEMTRALGSERTETDVLDVFFCNVGGSSNSCRGFGMYPFVPGTYPRGIAMQNTPTFCRRIAVHEVSCILAFSPTRSQPRAARLGIFSACFTPSRKPSSM